MTSDDTGQTQSVPALGLRSCVRPEGRFQLALHRPSYRVANLRESRSICELGRLDDGRTVTNARNFPQGEVTVPAAEGVYEIANAFPFRGTTFIGKAWADAKRGDPTALRLPVAPNLSMVQWFRDHLPARSGKKSSADLLQTLPEPVQLALAVNSTDPQDLTGLAEAAADLVHDASTGRPTGIRYVDGPDRGPSPCIRDTALFEAVANNPHLPDAYKDAMVLRPGAQGHSAIVGEYRGSGNTHVFEYLRGNSYIPWGHYAANMANDAVRYRPDTLTLEDMRGMRHLYYQRTYVRLAEMLGRPSVTQGRTLPPEELEHLRRGIRERLADPCEAQALDLNASLWGWNFGFDYAPSRYRLHASHQQVHQQYALIPRRVPATDASGLPCETLPAYACGDQIAAFIRDYRRQTGVDFFGAYLNALRTNRRTDGRDDVPASLVVDSDAHVMLFVPKAQTSQWELQIVTLAPVGNILETDAATRRSLDRALWVALRTLGAMGARMVTTIEYAKRFDAGDTGQHIVYSLLPRLPESPGAFSEAQLRWIIGHYPEDFAAACRTHLPEIP